ncbi:MAG: HD-GYP domain-containing protein, partial [Acutalibacteraceae bacterium]
RNYFAALCNSSQAVFVNNNLESELNSVEEKLFINLAKIVETRSNETSRHLNNVGLMTQIICSQLGYSDSESRLIATASMTHDIGKVAVPDAVLNKKGVYTSEERATMKKHTVYGYNILSVSNGRFFDIAAKIAKEHHENYDGSGYLGIKGEQIDRYARIVRVVDTFDALVSERCYKHAWSVEEAVSYINERSGIEFDPEIVEAFNVCKDDMISVRK